MLINTSVAHFRAQRKKRTTTREYRYSAHGGFSNTIKSAATMYANKATPTIFFLFFYFFFIIIPWSALEIWNGRIDTQSQHTHIMIFCDPISVGGLCEKFTETQQTSMWPIRSRKKATRSKDGDKDESKTTDKIRMQFHVVCPNRHAHKREWPNFRTSAQNNLRLHGLISIRLQFGFWFFALVLTITCVSNPLQRQPPFPHTSKQTQ